MILRALYRLFALAVLAYVLGYAAFAVLLPRPADDTRTDAIVVLTGGSGRLERGFDLIDRGMAERLLISGVARTVRPPELAEAYDVDPALLECCVTLGRESFDTRSNADEVARWMARRGYESMRLVTNDIHMPRARFEIEKRVPESIAILSDAVETNPSFQAIFMEYNKYLLGRVADLIGI